VGAPDPVRRGAAPVQLPQEVRAVATFSEDKVKEIIAKELEVDVKQLTNEAKFIEDLGADSLDIVELVMALEEEFGLDIPDEDADKMKTVGDAMAYLKSHANA
jgi:acyl carrier protein